MLSMNLNDVANASFEQLSKFKLYTHLMNARIKFNSMGSFSLSLFCLCALKLWIICWNFIYHNSIFEWILLIFIHTSSFFSTFLFFDLIKHDFSSLSKQSIQTRLEKFEWKSGENFRRFKILVRWCDWLPSWLAGSLAGIIFYLPVKMAMEFLAHLHSIFVHDEYDISENYVWRLRFYLSSIYFDMVLSICIANNCQFYISKKKNIIFANTHL